MMDPLRSLTLISFVYSVVLVAVVVVMREENNYPPSPDVASSVADDVAVVAVSVEQLMSFDMAVLVRRLELAVSHPCLLYYPIDSCLHHCPHHSLIHVVYQQLPAVEWEGSLQLRTNQRMHLSWVFGQRY